MVRISKSRRQLWERGGRAMLSPPPMMDMKEMEEVIEGTIAQLEGKR